MAAAAGIRYQPAAAATCMMLNSSIRKLQFHAELPVQ